MAFINLHVHNEFSFDAVGTSKHLAAAAAALNQPAIALTNHGTVAGTIHHIDACQAAGIMPIIGLEAYYRPVRKVQQQKELRYEYLHLTLLAKNAVGWKNLMMMSNEAHISGFYEKACIDLELLRKYHEGIIVGLGCLRGPLCKFIEAGDELGARRWIKQIKDLFGDDIFGEIMPSALPEQVVSNLPIVSMCQEEGLMLGATTDAHAPDKLWVPTQDVRLMIMTNQTVKKREVKRKEGIEVFEFRDDTYYVQSEEEVLANFAANHPSIPTSVVQEAVNNTLLIAGRITPFLIGKYEKMPSFARKEPDIDILRRLSYEGLVKHGTRHNKEYEDRLEDELGQIEKAGLAPYLLMVYDTVEWAMSDRGLPDADGHEEPGQKVPIEVGPGRGSAAGSLVCDSIGITNMDPIAYRLLFERFHNIDRKGMPDIDVDFPTDRIDIIEEYTKRRFGRDHVYDVIARSTFGPRACVRRVGTVLCLNFNLIDDAAKSIDEGERAPLEELRSVNPNLQELAEKYPEAWVHMTRLQGQIMGMSEHAAALLVTPPDLPATEIIPLERKGGMKGKIVTGWGEASGKGNAILSDYGFMKFDWLRIAELDKQAFAVQMIEKRTGEKISLKDLPCHRDPFAVDEEVMDAFAKRRMVGIFQLGQTAKSLTGKLKPKNILELAAINALIRPGPRGHGDDMEFVERKHGRRETTYWHPNLEPYLDYTFGVLVFQEQLIHAVHHLGGLTKGEADNFRKIASKLYRDPVYARETMGLWQEPIFAGFKANGLSQEQCDQIWENFLSFSDYSFNLAHAAGYALLAYRGMWLKVKYPGEFYAAFLSKGLSQKKELAGPQKEEAVREARATGFDIKLPDINSSEVDYTVTSAGSFQLGLDSILHVGPVAVKTILAHRPYNSYQDFSAKVPAQQCNVTVKGALIAAGAFDFDNMRRDRTPEEIDALEREYLGISISSPFSADRYKDVIEPRITPEDEVEDLPDGARVVAGGDVVNVKEIRDKKGGLMAFADIAYGTDAWSVTFFSHTYKLYKDLLNSHRPIILVGNKNTYKGRASVIPQEPEPQRTASGEIVVVDGHEVWTHYVQDVADLATLVRVEAEPLPDHEPVAA